MAKTLSKKAKIIIIALTAVVLIAGAVFLGFYGVNAAAVKSAAEFDYSSITGGARNVVLMIGDGMGFKHLEMIKYFFKRSSVFMESAPLKGEVTTFSRNFLGPTDSAAAATALATGEKVLNGRIAYRDGKNLKTIVDYAQDAGKAVGIIATESVYGATPAAFSAHSKSRRDDEAIFRSQMTSGIDLFCGLNSDYQDKESEIKDAGYSYETGIESLSENEKVFIALDKISTGYTDSKAPTLAEISLAAMEYLSRRSPDGYFLMIEESHIDKKSHSNDYDAMLEHLYAYDQAVHAVVDQTSESRDTVVIVTADHETGRIKPADNKYGFKFTSAHHSSQNVPYFMFGNIAGVPPVIDNTNIFGICKKIITAA